MRAPGHTRTGAGHGRGGEGPGLLQEEAEDEGMEEGGERVGYWGGEDIAGVWYGEVGGQLGWRGGEVVGEGVKIQHKDIRERGMVGVVCGGESDNR